jgi:hypothetical protein
VTGGASAYEVRPARADDLLGVVVLHSPTLALGVDQISESQQLTSAQMLGTDGMTV